jgi:hypothetical protein
MNDINPRAIAVVWCLTVLMAGAIALGPNWIYGVAAVSIAYTIYSLLP